jgi:hypothetical protein
MLNVGSSTAQVYVGNTLASEVYLGTVKVWPDKAPELFTFPYVSGLATQHNWNIPSGAKHVDLIVCGAGGGGSNGTLVLGNGKGGSAGKWNSTRVSIGIHVGAGSLIQFSVGNPGAGGGALNTPGRGGSTAAYYERIPLPTSDITTYDQVTVTGDGGKPLDAPGVEGVASGNFIFNGFTYPGGAGGGNPGTGPGKPGTAPGGGGGGGGGQQAVTQLGAAGGGGIAYARVFYS